MNKVVILLLMCAISCVSCKKDDPVEPFFPDAYMNLTAGSTWNYESVDVTAGTTSPYILTCTSKDSSISGKTYRVFTNSSGSSNEYYNITGNDYYNFRKLPTILGTGNVEYVYLNDNSPTGTTWDQTYPISVSGFNFNVTLTNTIAQKGLSKTVKGIAYTDVIQVNTVLKVSIGPVPLPASALTSDIQSFYAPRVGLIESTTKINLNFNGIVENTDQQTSLLSSDIK